MFNRPMFKERQTWPPKPSLWARLARLLKIAPKPLTEGKDRPSEKPRPVNALPPVPPPPGELQ